MPKVSRYVSLGLGLYCCLYSRDFYGHGGLAYGHVNDLPHPRAGRSLDGGQNHICLASMFSTTCSNSHL